MNARVRSIGVVCALILLGPVLGTPQPRGANAPAPPRSAPPDPDGLALASVCPDSETRSGGTPERSVPFAPGEVLEYDITRVPYVVSGTATAAVREKERACGTVVYRIVAEGRPVPLLARLYRLTYRAGTLLDATNLLPRASAVYSEEGKRRRLKVTAFEPGARRARFIMETTTRLTKELAAPPEAHDPLSIVYALRALPLHVGETMTVPVTESGRWYTVAIRIEMLERVETGLGSVTAYRLAADARDEAGRRPLHGIRLWLSADERRWPVKLVTELRFGPLTFTLRAARLATTVRGEGQRF